MGVRGLTTYISENSTKFLKPYELSNCYLVVDGNGVASCLYDNKTEKYSAFGGDYDEFQKIVKDFFLLLKKCNVKPLVIFDGGHEKRKINLVKSRRDARKYLLVQFLQGFSTTRFFPLFLKKTFCDVLQDLEIFCVQTNLEADVELAAIARALNCPLLSNDSDFYIFGVLYIPFKYLQLEPIKHSNSNNYFLKCMLYDVTSAFPGLDKSLLPILATVVGNDYVNSSIFNKFFKHVSIKKKKYNSYQQCKIHATFLWLKSENPQSAIQLILNHVKKSMRAKVLYALETSINDYTSNYVSECVLNKLTPLVGDVGLVKKNFKTKLPPEIFNLYCDCKINTFLMDIIKLGCYFTHLQVEILNRPSHFASMELIKHLINILEPYFEHKQEQVKVFLIMKFAYCGISIHTELPTPTADNCLHSLLTKSRETRLGFLLKIVNIDKEELKIISQDNSWYIFILSFIYWLKKFGNELTHAHIHSLLLMAIVNEIAQKCVGYFRRVSKFNRSKGSLLIRFEGTPIMVGEGSSFEEMIENVSLHEKLLIQKDLIPYQQTTETEKKSYAVKPVHYFNCFQSILFHIMEINALFNFPLPALKIANFYSGTLLYNFFLTINSTKPPVTTFGYGLLKNTPNLAKIYTYLCESLAKFFPENSVPVRRGKRRNKKKNKSSQGGRK